LSAPLIELLQIALSSHREALDIQQDNADILFNTAQVLTSLAEAVTDCKRPSDAETQKALKFLQEALELFQRCLALQEFRFTESQQQAEMMQSDAFQQGQGDLTMESEADTPGSLETEQWVSVIEPVTRNTLLDSALAQLETLTTLCGLLTFDLGSGLAWIEEYSWDLLREKIVAYADGTERRNEAALAQAEFISTLMEVSYRGGKVDLETYKNELSRAFEDEVDISNDPRGLCSQTDALVAFNAAVADTCHSHKPDVLSKSLALRWQSLSSAQGSLAAASKLPAVEHLSKIHIARGDVEMYRWRLGRPPWNYAVSHENASTLLGNAQTYYRGAAAIAQRDGTAEEKKEGLAKEALAAALGGDTNKMKQVMANNREQLVACAEDMVEDELVAVEDMDRLHLLNAPPEEIVF
jgi:hypothetical protein